MNLLTAIRNHPLSLAAGLLLAFGGWVAFDAAGRSRAPDEPLNAPPVNVPSAMALKPPHLDDTVQIAPARDPFRPGVVTADLIPRLQPGMARAAVEELIGVPPAALVHPVSIVDGKFIYRASYLANLESGADQFSPVPRSIIAIEFDAGSPGHPLLKVLTDPML